MYRFTDGGLRNVWLVNGYKIKDTPYGEAIAFHDADGLTKAICQALIRKKSKLTGAEFRYIRQAMLLSQASVGKTLGRTDQAVALWEKRSMVPKFADMMIRVLFAAHSDGNERVKNIVHALNDTERSIHIIMKETSKGWTHTEQEADESELESA
jgi:DNA-binding transcriptional regulator YiaG